MLSDLMTWRYSAKAYDPNKKLSDDQLNAILQSIQLTPTSSGSQPFEVFVITNPETRKNLGLMGMNQGCVDDCSHVLVFASWDNYTAERIDAISDLTAATRGPNDMISQYYERVKALYLPRDAHTNAEHTARQTYIAMGFAMLAAAEQKVDATPMEGFDPAVADETLGLKEKGLKSQLVLTLGFRGENDWLEKLPKVRKSDADMFTYID